MQTTDPARPACIIIRYLNLNLETAMRRFIMLMATVLVVAFTVNPAYAAPRGAKPKAPPAAKAEDKPKADPPKADKKAKAAPTKPTHIVPIKDWPQLLRVAQTIGLYYRLTMQETYIDGRLRPAIKKAVDKETFKRFANMLEGFGFILSATGDIVPAEELAVLLAYLKSESCEKSGDKWSTTECYALWKKVKKTCDDLIAAAPPGDFKDIAARLLSTAVEYAEYLDEDGKTMVPVSESLGDAIILAQGAIIAATVVLPEAKRPWALSTSDLNSLLGKKACHEDKPDCNNTIVGFDEDGGVLFDGDLGSGGTTWADTHSITTSVRFQWSFGGSDGYEGLTTIGGVMPMLRYNFNDYFAGQLGFGVGWLSGQSEVGNVEADSSVIPVGVAGLAFLLGSRDWALAPVLELNMTWQGFRPGVEAATGFSILPGSPVDLLVLGTLAYRPTEVVLFTNPDGKPTPALNMASVGFGLQAGYSW